MAGPVPSPERDPRYDAGVRLFNAHEWFECHEVLESLWRDDPSPGRAFYQGLIMAAVALEHWRRGNPRGARSQWEQGRRYLERFPTDHARLDLAGFMARMDVLMAPIMARSDDEWRSEEPAVPELPYGKVPRIVLEP